MNKRRRRRFFDDAAAVHDGDVVGEFGNDSEIMGDQNHRHPGLGLKLPKKLQYLRLDGDVERRRRLVGDQQRRSAGKRQRDHRPLVHAAGQLMRIAVGTAFGIGNADPIEQLARAGGGGARGELLVNRQHLGDLPPHGLVLPEPMKTSCCSCTRPAAIRATAILSEAATYIRSMTGASLGSAPP